MGNDDDYYKNSVFDGYVVTSVNPGLRLLGMTSCYVAFTVLLAMLLRFKKSRKNMKEYDTNDLAASKKKLKSVQGKNKIDDFSSTQEGMEFWRWPLTLGSHRNRVKRRDQEQRRNHTCYK